MTIILINKTTHKFQVKGETTVYRNVKEIREHENGGLELVINKNWSIFTNPETTRIEIL